MTLAAWIELITLALKFPSALLEVARLFQKTPEQKHEEIIGQVEKWLSQSSESDRPTWEHP